MKISYSSVFSQICDSFKEKIQISLTEQQKKIVALVTLIFSGIILINVGIRLFKAKPIIADIEPESPKVKPITPKINPVLPHIPVSPLDLNKTNSPQGNPLFPKPVPPFLGSHAAPVKPSKPQGYEWVEKKNDAKTFMTTTQDMAIICEIARSTLPVYTKYPELYLNICDLMEFASLDQIKAITLALAQNNDLELLKNIFSFFINDPDKDKMETVVKSLTPDQFMSLLYIPKAYLNEYQQQDSFIHELPLQSILKFKTQFSFPDQFIDGCEKLVQYSKDIQPAVNHEIKNHGYLCD